MTLSKEKQIEYTIQALKSLMAESEKESMTITLDLSHEPKLFESKFAGTGYLPHGAAIPTNAKGEQLRLLAQIACEDVAIENFPKTGLLQFWAMDDDLTGADFDKPTNQDGFRILYHATVDTTVTEAEILEQVIPLEDESYFPIEKEVALKFTKTKEPLSFGDYQFEKLFAKKFNELSEETIGSNWDLDIDLWDDIEEPDCKKFIESSGWGHKVGGYPAFTQTDPRSEGDGFDTVLLQIDSQKIDEKHEIIWGDCGICNFFINSEKLKALDFSEVIYNWDCY